MTTSPIVAFRVDASHQIGTGHTVRCLTLADQLRSRGAVCHFLQRRHAGHMIDVIRDRGFEVHALSEPVQFESRSPAVNYRAWLGVEEKEDAQETGHTLSAIGADQVVVDHYGIGAMWHSDIRRLVRSIVVIDDLANRFLDCDVLLNQNFADDLHNRYNTLVPEHCIKLLGPNFALINPVYGMARRFTEPRRGSVARVMISFGGSDSQDLTGLTLRTLSRPEFVNLAIDVVLGQNYSHTETLKAMAAKRGAVMVYGPQPTLLPLMLRADLAVGGGGATMWERCCVGLPSVVVPIAENQQPATAALAQVEACWALSPISSTQANESAFEEELALAVHAFMSDSRLTMRIAESGWRLGEGRGAAAVAEVLIPSDLRETKLRAATTEDIALYWRWANDPSVREAAHNSHGIPWFDHEAWFKGRLEISNSVLWVLETPHGVPVGQVRIDERSNCGVVSYSLDKAFRGRGLGRELIRQGVEEWRRLHPKIPLIAEVKSSNGSSLSVFRSLGWQEQANPEIRDGGHVFTYAAHNAG